SLFNYNEAKLNYLYSIKIFKQFNDSTNLNKVKANLAMWYQRNGNNDSALIIYLDVLDFSKRNKQVSAMATSYTNIAVIYHSMGQLLKAYEFFVKSHEMYAKLGKSHRFYVTLQNIGKTQLALNQYQEAIETLRKTEKYFISNSFFNSIGDVYHDKAIAFYNLKQSDSALQTFNAAIENYNKVNNKASIVLCYIELGVQSKSLEQSKNYFLKAKNLLNQPEVNKITKAHYSKVIGSFLVEKKSNLIGSYLKLSELWNAKRIYKDSERLPDQIELFKVFEKYYYKKGKVDSAYAYLKQIKVISDSMANSNNKSNLAEAAISFKYDKQIFKDSVENAQIKAQKDAQISLEQSRVKQQKTISYASIGGGLLVLLLAVSIYYSRQKTRKQNIAITEQKEAIEKRNTQIEWLLKEIHHRVKNNLQIVSSLMSIQGRS
ncbi:MAG: tetratricopeptide repeat protein, partial [Bacteroidia bacterium]